MNVLHELFVAMFGILRCIFCCHETKQQTLTHMSRLLFARITSSRELSLPAIGMNHIRGEKAHPTSLRAKYRNGFS